MRIGRWIKVAVLLWFSAGCAANPGLLQKVNDSVAAVQQFYGPLIQKDLAHNEAAKQAVVAADTTLLLASKLQAQWFPNSDQTKQLELQAQEAQKLAQKAGVTAAGAAQGQASTAGE